MLATNDYGDTTSDKLISKLGKQISIVGYVVDIKNTSTRNGDLMHFGAFYDKHGIFFDTVHFPNVARDYPFRGRGFYRMKGKVVEDFGVPIIEVHWMEKLPLIDRNKQVAI